MKISIIIPVFNSQRYIGRCIESILNQTHKDIEIVLVNDGSKDRSGELCEEYARRYAGVKVIHKQNEGPSSARNSGLGVITGDYVGFVDSDDWVEESMYKALLESACDDGSDVVCCGYKVVDNNRIKSYVPVCRKTKSYLLNKKEHKELVYEMFINSQNGLFCIWNKLYKASLILENHILFPEDKMLAEDCEFNLSILNKATKYTFIPNCYYNYFMTTSSLTRGYIENYFEKHLGWRSILENNIPKEYVFAEKSTRILNSMTIHEIIYAINQELLFNEDLSVRDVLKTRLNNQIIEEAFEKYKLMNITSIKSLTDRIYYTLLSKKMLVLYHVLFKSMNYLKTVYRGVFAFYASVKGLNKSQYSQ